jgi:hypothetical protein
MACAGRAGEDEPRVKQSGRFFGRYRLDFRIVGHRVSFGLIGCRREESINFRGSLVDAL